LPFRDFSFVLKAQSEEYGTTGIREAVVLDEHFRAGRDPEEAFADVYDVKLKTQPLRNISEDEKYDAKFPQHPLSRARRLMRHLVSTLVVGPEVKAATPF
jgi:hypothetical protein